MPFDLETGEIFDLDRVRAWEKGRLKAIEKGLVGCEDISSFTHRRYLIKRRYAIYKEGRCPRLGWMDMAWAMECLSAPNIKLLTILGCSLDFHNYAIIRPKEIMEKMGWKKRMFDSRMLELRKMNCLVIHKVKMEVKGEKLIELHPFFQNKAKYFPLCLYQ